MAPGRPRNRVRLLTILAALQAVSPVSADDGGPANEDPPQVGASIRSDSIWFMMPERWGTVHITARNPRSEPARLLITTSFEGDDNLQFGRRIDVPPHARVRTFHHVLAPLPSSPTQRSFDSETLVFDAGTALETPLADRWGQRHQPGTFLIGHDEPVTVILDDSDPTIEGGLDAVSVADLVYTARYERSYWRNVIVIGQQALSPGETALDAVDQLVIADNRVTRDLLTPQGIRQWLYGGGLLWVMLDRVDAGVLEAIVGDAFACEIVDRVSLTHVAIDSTRGRTSQSGTEHEQPVNLVRVVTSGVDVEYTVNGWPAAFWMNCGEGRLLVTTLAAEGWVRPRTSRDPFPSGDESHASHLIPGPPLQQLAADFFVPRTAPPLPPEVAEEHVREYVGYSIPSRVVVLGMMTGFVIVLAGLGYRQSRSGRLEWMGILGPAAALITGSLLIAMGQLQRRSIPTSVSVLQFVQPISGTGDVRISATAGIYSSEGGDAEFSGTSGGRVLPDMTGMEDTARRLVWTDLETWRWENLPNPPGLRTAVLLESQHSPEPVRAEFQFDEQGVIGHLALPDGLSASDGVLATPRGRIGVDFEDDGTLRASADNVLTGEQFFSARVLTDEQVRRSQSLQRMLRSSETRPFPQHPTLLFWTEPWESGLQFNDRFQSTGSALVAIPVAFDRPAVGTEITIPAPLLPYREAIDIEGVVPAGFFDYRQRAWLRKSSPTSTWLQFQVPPSLLPIELRAARLVIHVDGPVGKLSIAGRDGDEIVPVETWTDPVGTLFLTIDDPRALSLTGDGRLLLQVAGGDPERPELTHSSDEGIERVSYWRIESLSLELTAMVTDRSG